MVTEVYIKNNKNAPIRYLCDLENFKNGTRYTFKEGVNIIVGENGCGKTTLLNLIRDYLLVDETECGRGMFNGNINRLMCALENTKMFDGVDVYADYKRNTFRLRHMSEISNSGALKDLNSFSTFFAQKSASTGEGVSIALNELFNKLFGLGAKLKFDYTQFDKLYPIYTKYVSKHKIKGNEWTILMDEPDRNLDINRIDEIKEILSFHKEHTQIIAVIHNPLLIYSLAKNKEVNFIEMTEGYIGKVCGIVDNLIKQ